MDLTGLGSVADLAKGIVDRFFPAAATEAEKLAAKVQIEQQLQARENAVLDTQKAVMSAEMAQGDVYTKRARPTIVYFGLLAIGLVHVLFPIIACLLQIIHGSTTINLPEITLPEQFWYTWGGVCSIWIIGRTAERRGAAGTVIAAITGGK